MAKTGFRSTRVHACRTRSPPSVLLLAILTIFSLLSATQVVVSFESYDFPSGPIIGIHLGTTSSCVAFELDRDQDRRVEVITNEQGHRTTPAWVAFGDGGRLPLIGGAAKNASDYMSIGQENIVFDARRLIGRTMEDPEVQKDLDIRGKQWPFKVHSNGDGKPVYRINVGVKNGENGEGGKNGEDGKNVTVQHELELTPEDISGMVLRNMKETAETYLGTKVEQAIITVPTYFNDAQRQATIDAAAFAGLQVRRIINEPTAVAVAYGLNKKDGEFHVLVYHLGGATFEAALTKLDDGVFEILANVSSTRLGGEEFNRRMMEHVLESYGSYQSDQSNQSKTGTDIDMGSGLAASASGPSVAMGKLKRDIERAKRTLSSQQSARIDIERSKNVEDTDTGNDISTVYSVTLTRAMFEELNDDLFRETIKLVEQVLREAGVTKADVDIIILTGGSTRIPKVHQLITAYFNKDPLKGIEPDEAAAYGAAVIGGVLSGHEHYLLDMECV